MAEVRISACSPHDFGAAIAASGDELVIGAPCRDYGGLRAYGHAITPPAVGWYRREGGVWRLLHVLTSPDEARDEGFARAVALAGDAAVVGSPGHENGDGPSYCFDRAGRAMVAFSRPLEGDFDEIFEEQGVAVATDGKVVAVGAPLAEAAYLFEGGRLTILRGTHPGEGFGSALAIDGDRLLVGAAAHYGGGALAGAVYLHRRHADGAWREIARLAGRVPGEAFGAVLAIDGGRLAVGAPAGGRVDLFELRGDACVSIASVQETPTFGGAVALAGDRLAIGDVKFGAQQGRVGLYRVGAAVTRERWLTVPDAAPFTRLGAAVALGPDYVAAGAPGLGKPSANVGFVIVDDFG